MVLMTNSCRDLMMETNGCDMYCMTSRYHLLQLLNGFSLVQPLGAHNGTLHDGLAAVEAPLVVQVLQAFLRWIRRGYQSPGSRKARSPFDPPFV